MRALILGVALFVGALFAGSPEGGLTASARAAIEKAVLEVNRQMTRAAEDRDIDRLFSFMLANDRGSIIQSGNLFETREDALATVKRNFQGIAAINYRWKRQLVTVISPTVALLVCDGESEIRTAQEPPSTFVTPVRAERSFRAYRWKVEGPARSQLGSLPLSGGPRKAMVCPTSRSADWRTGDRPPAHPPEAGGTTNTR